MRIRKLTKKMVVEVEKGSSEIKELSDGVLKIQRKWSSGTIKALVFRFSYEDDSVRKKKIKTSKVLYKFVSDIKKV